MAFAMITFAPSATPMKRFSISPMTGLFAPTAATAIVLLSPVKLPTTARSEALKSCSSMAVAATGSAKSGSLFQIEPFSISILAPFFSFFIFITHPYKLTKSYIAYSLHTIIFVRAIISQKFQKNNAEFFNQLCIGMLFAISRRSLSALPVGGKIPAKIRG